MKTINTCEEIRYNPLVPAVAAIAIPASAQVYSANIVGYVNATAPSGFSILANPFNTGSNGADVVLPATDGSQVLKWTGTSFNTWFYDVAFGGWVDDVLNWFYNIFTSIPYLLLVLAVAAL